MPDGSNYRNAPTSDAPARKGFLDSMLGYRPPSDTPMPKLRTAFTRGVVAVFSSPWLLAAAIATVLAVWLGVVAAGLPGPFGAFGGFLAVPPISTNLDVTLPLVLLPANVSLLGGLLSVLPRGIFLALTTGIIVDTLDGKRVSAGSLRRGIRALPTAISVCILGIGFLIFTSTAGRLLGPGIGTLIQVGIPAFGVYLFGFAVTIAASERRSMADSLAKSYRAARIPGTGNLLFAVLYVFGSLAMQVVLATSYGRFDVNPTIAAWFWVLLANILHMCVYAALAFRYLSIADSVPDAPPRAARGSTTRPKPPAKKQPQKGSSAKNRRR